MDEYRQTLGRRTFFKLAGAMSALSQAGFSHAGEMKEAGKQQYGNGLPPQRAGAASAIYLSDLDNCSPSSSLSSEGKRFCWRKIEYETDAFHGVMLMAGEETEAAAVSYPLKATGWYDIYIGMFNTSWHPYSSQTLWAKLASDPAFSCLYLPVPNDRPGGTANNEDARWIGDVFWKTGKLTDEKVIFKQPVRLVVPNGQPYGDVCHELWVAYIKLVPLTDDEARAVQDDRAQTRTKRLFAYNDCFSFIFDRGETVPGEASAATIRAQLEPYRNSDFRRIYWDGTLGDQCFYFTKTGRTWTRKDVHVDDFTRVGDRLIVEAWDDYFQKGIDPLQVAAESSHEVGLEFHACFRLGGGMGAFYWPPPFDGFNKGGFYEKHPELRCVRRDGTPAPRISFAFPETQRFVLSLIEEMATYPIDGISMLFNRQPPVVEYEAPLLEGFKAEYGQDARALDERDPRWLSYRCRTVTAFMRRLRKELDAAAEKQNRSKRFTISAWVSGREEENLDYGFDVKAWVHEKFVDTLIPYTSAGNLFSGDLAWENPSDVNYWLNMTRNTKCELALNVLPRNLPATQYYRKAHQLYQSGVNYLAFWDTSIIGSTSSDALRRLGHQEEIAALLKEGGTKTQPNGTRLRKIAGWEMKFIPE